MTVLAWIVVLVYLVVPSAVCVAKGKPGMAIFAGTAAWVGAVRLALPSSAWARRYYDAEKLERARERFAADVEAEHDPELLAAWDGVEINPDELDPMTRRALRKQGRI